MSFATSSDRIFNLDSSTMPTLTLESLPYDIFHHILLEIDEKADLDNLCLAFPNSAGRFVQQHPGILDNIYWSEIERLYILPLALLNFRFHRSHASSRVLSCLGPQGRRETTTSSLYSWIWGRPNSRDNLVGEINPASIRRARAVIKSLDATTASQMKALHLQIEKLADIFVNYQLKPHYSPSFSSRIYRPLTTTERKRVMKAIYKAWVIILWMRSESERNRFQPTDVDCEDPSRIPDMDLRFYAKWTDNWRFWDAREAEVVMSVLWKEIPKRVSEEGFGKQWPAVESWETIGSEPWVIPADDTRKNTIYIDRSTDLIDFIITGSKFDLEKHVELLECLGDKDMAMEAMRTLLLSDGDTRWVFNEPGSQNGGIDASHRTQLLIRCDAQLKRTQYSGMAKVHKDTAGDMYCDPPLRRLVKGRGGVIVVSEFEDRARNDNWTEAERVIVRDCMWDDQRLEELGYQFPEFWPVRKP
ncbi:hypothetical protein TWF281_010046 [Arthrobotrys megalospora]